MNCRPQSKFFVSSPRRFADLIHSDDDVALFVSGIDVGMRDDHLGKIKASVDDGMEISGSGEINDFAQDID